MDKKIAVLAPGAIGAPVGGLLTKAGHDVVLIDQWPAHVDAMKANGLLVRKGREANVPTPMNEASAISRNCSSSLLKIATAPFTLTPPVSPARLLRRVCRVGYTSSQRR